MPSSGCTRALKLSGTWSDRNFYGDQSTVERLEPSETKSSRWLAVRCEDHAGYHFILILIQKRGFDGQKKETSE
jgi:hypothetical protein